MGRFCPRSVRPTDAPPLHTCARALVNTYTHAHVIVQHRRRPALSAAATTLAGAHRRRPRRRRRLHVVHSVVRATHRPGRSRALARYRRHHRRRGTTIIAVGVRDATRAYPCDDFRSRTCPVFLFPSCSNSAVIGSLK